MVITFHRHFSHVFVVIKQMQFHVNQCLPFYEQWKLFHRTHVLSVSLYYIKLTSFPLYLCSVFFHCVFRHPVYSETILLPQVLSDNSQVSLYSNKFVEMKILINNREIINITQGIRTPCARCNCVILPRCVHPLFS